MLRLDAATLRRDACDMRDERAEGRTTIAAPAPEANTCCSSELLDDLDWAGLGGGAAVPEACSHSCTLEWGDDSGDTVRRPNNNNDWAVRVSTGVCTCTPVHTATY